MQNNLVIDGILNDAVDEEDKCKDLVKDFFEKELEIEVGKDEIKKAHRLGEIREGKHHAVVVKCAEKLKHKVLKNKKRVERKSERAWREVLH